MSEANRLVIFDCDGTLVDSQHMIVGAMHRTFDDLQIDAVSDHAVRRVIGLSLEEAMAQLRPDLALDDHLKMTDHYKSVFYDMREKTAFEPDPLYQDTEKVLKQLNDAGFLLAVATGNSKRGLDRVIEQHGLASYFISLQCADGHPSKPHPSMIHQAMADAGADVGTTVMVGDTTFDMSMASNAKVLALGVDWGYHGADELVAAGAHHVASEYGEVPALINRLISARV